MFAALLPPAGVAGQGGGTSSDRQALEALYRATNGPEWTDSTNWLTDAPLSEWFGVTTDASGRVTGLELADNGLSGPLLGALGELANLQTLSLWRNELTGPIPSSLGNLSDLRWLYLSDNGLTGPIPSSLGRLSNLRSLQLWRNGLTGRLPDGVFV